MTHFKVIIRDFKLNSQVTSKSMKLYGFVYFFLSFLYFSVTISFAASTRNPYLLAWKLDFSHYDSREEHSLFIAYIANSARRPTVINPNPFNMQISTPPTARGLHICFPFFHHERVSIADVIHTRSGQLREWCHSLRRIRYYLYFPLCRFFSTLHSHIIFMYICTAAKYVQR